MTPDQQLIVEAVKRGFLDPAKIDRTTGAPAGVREAVGGAPANDRLATIQKFYPDAFPYQGDNFIFNNPQTGQPTLYNEENASLLGIPIPTPGDIASVAREGMVMAGGGLGGSVAAMSAPFTAGMGAAAIPAGVGVGAAGAGALYDFLHNLRGLPDTRSTGERLAGPVIEGVSNAVAQKAGDLIPAGIKAVTQGVKNRMAGVDPAQLAADFAATGADATAGQITGNRMFQGVENAAGKLPTSASRMQQFVVRQLEALGTKLEDIASGYGNATSQTEAGGAVQKGVSDFIGRFAKESERNYRKLDQYLPKDTPVTVQNTVSTLQGLKDQFASAPTLGEKLQNPTLKGYLDAILTDAQKGAMDYQTLKAFRTTIGRKLSDPSAWDDVPRAELKNVYGALTADMQAAATAAGPEATAAFNTANAHFKAGIDQIDNTLAKFVEGKTPEQAFQMAMSGANKGASNLQALKAGMPDPEWNMLSSFVLRDMGKATPGAQSAQGDLFSPATFLTNWNKMSPEAKDILFGGTKNSALRDSLDALTRVSGAVKDTAAMANPSGTAQTSMFMNVLTGGTLGAGAASLTGGDAGTGFAVGALAPYAAARLMTSPGFVRWLVKASKVNGANLSEVSGQMARLGEIAKTSDPETAQAIHQYYQALTGSNSGTAKPQTPVQ